MYGFMLRFPSPQTHTLEPGRPGHWLWEKLMCDAGCRAHARFWGLGLLTKPLSLVGRVPSLPVETGFLEQVNCGWGQELI